MDPIVYNRQGGRGRLTGRGARLGLAALLVVVLGLAAFWWVFAWPRVDSCLDGGGSWNDERQECERGGMVEVEQ
jgi:hypothetical protein